jgi:GntR family transcriptional regulator / MocR family aminotransferase
MQAAERLWYLSTSNLTVETQTNSWAGFPADLLIELPVAGGRGIRERLEQGLRRAIQEERLRGGAVLPPSRVLAADLGIARSVVVEAYRNLAADGYLEARRGGWTRVRPHRQAPQGDDGTAQRGYEQELFYGWRRPSGGQQTIRLLGGLPDPALFPRREWLRHYRAALSELPYPDLGYPDILGGEPLREALADYLRRARGAVATAERVLICSGFTQGLTLVCRVLRRAGARRVAVEEPCHGWHRDAIRAHGLEPVPIRVDDRGLDPAALADADAQAVLVAPAHSYPSGSTLGGERRQLVAAWAEQRGAVVIEDDYDAELRYDRSPLGALQGLAPEHVIHIGTASKTLSPALRLGWVLAPARLIDALAREKHDDDLGSSLLEQLALARFIDSGAYARHLRRVRPIYEARRDAAIAALEATLPDARWHGEAAGLHLYVTLPARVDEHALTRRAYEHRVHVGAGAWHWAGGPPGPSLVIGYGSATEPAIGRGVEVIATAIDE